MPLLRGHPQALLGFFFTFAVFLTGVLYSISGEARFGSDLLDTLTVAVLVLSLLMVLLILARILWVTAGVASRQDSSHTDERF